MTMRLFILTLFAVCTTGTVVGIVSYRKISAIKTRYDEERAVTSNKIAVVNLDAGHGRDENMA